MELQLGSRQLADLLQVVQLGPAVLEEVCSALRSRGKELMSPDSLEQVVGSVLKEPGSAEAVVRTILPLGHILAGLDSADEALELLRPHVSEESDLANLGEVMPILRDLASLSAVKLVRQALDLSYEYTNLLRSARIVTDIRPLFQEDGVEIDACVISQTLRLRFDGYEGGHELSIAVDQADVKELARQCERALIKAETAQKFLMEKGRINSLITGD